MLLVRDNKITLGVGNRNKRQRKKGRRKQQVGMNNRGYRERR
jgi:hypothetical protein